MIKRIDRLIRPDEFYNDLFQPDYDRFYQQGIRLIMLDIDNTLARHGACVADEYARNAIDQIKAAKILCLIVSNGGERRVRQYAASLSLPFIPRANKPSARALRQACQNNGVQTSQAMMIGDQLFTDIAGAHRAGCRAVLVRPRFREESWNIRLKRLIEEYFYHRYQLR